mgnify:CR=1 FL=1
MAKYAYPAIFEEDNGSIAVVFPDGKEFVVRGTCEGTRGFEAMGSNGFGYDNLFIVNKYDKTFAELPATIKNAIMMRLPFMVVFLVFCSY